MRENKEVSIILIWLIGYKAYTSHIKILVSFNLQIFIMFFENIFKNLWGLAEKFIGWPKYPYGMWPNVVYFSK